MNDLILKWDNLASSYRQTVSDDVLQRQRDELDDANWKLLAAIEEKNSLIEEIKESTLSLTNANNQI